MDANVRFDHQLLAVEGEHDVHCMLELEAPAAPDTGRPALHLALVNHHIKHEYYVGGHGGHDWATWRHLLHERFLPHLWRKE